jgi:hypothetical protein
MRAGIALNWVAVLFVVAFPYASQIVVGQEAISVGDASGVPRTGSTEFLADYDPKLLRERLWTWEEGTVFGDGAHLINISSDACGLGPSLSAYKIKEGTRLLTTFEHDLSRKRAFDLRITTKPDGQHMYLQPLDGVEIDLGEEKSWVDIELNGMAIDLAAL